MMRASRTAALRTIGTKDMMVSASVGEDVVCSRADTVVSDGREGEKVVNKQRIHRTWIINPSAWSANPNGDKDRRGRRPRCRQGQSNRLSADE